MHDLLTSFHTMDNSSYRRGMVQFVNLKYYIITLCNIDIGCLRSCSKLMPALTYIVHTHKRMMRKFVNVTESLEVLGQHI